MSRPRPAGASARSRAGLLALAALAVACLAGCGGSSGDGSGRPTVVASTSVAADIVANVAGRDAEVIQLVPDGATPHSYAPSAREQQELADADLVVYFSPALEEALPLDSAKRSFAIADHGGSSGSTAGGPGDPHVWLDPTLIAAALPALASTMGEIDAEHARSYQRRATAYADRLLTLDRRIRRITSAIPAAERKLVTSHDLFGYFADRYAFEFIGAPFGLSPEAEASAGALADLIVEVKASGVPAVFAQIGDDPKVLRRVADEAGVVVVDDLPVESLGDGADTYEAMMLITARKISDALGR